ncbi:MAG TPA: glycosyltransferase [Candidatus Baltobacteraceae bacterium]|nr:glycosyltransferase [Candidatus Baltobacteraceae bacterium]
MRDARKDCPRIAADTARIRSEVARIYGKSKNVAHGKECNTDLRVAAHLILGPREEPFLGALCESLKDACDVLLVNDNSPDPSPHAATLAQSTFGKTGRLIVDRTPFTDFASARNVCVRLHREHDAGDWVVAVDGDDVHTPDVANITRNLHAVPEHIDYVDGYIRHFFQSFDWYMSVDRHRSFFRFKPELQWERSVHEQLAGLSGKRLALPYVYAHYGWVVPAQLHADKLRQYMRLGAPDETHESALERVRPNSYVAFEKRWATAIRFTGAHPAAAQPTIEQIRRRRGPEFEQVDALVRESQSLPMRVRNAAMRWNFELRWRGRAINPLARRILG